MIEGLPFYIPLVFIITVFLTLWFLYKASQHSRTILLFCLLWLLLQGILSNTGFYLDIESIPPRISFALVPAMLLIAFTFLTKRGLQFIDSLRDAWLTWLHIVRIPVEIVLFWLFIHDKIPQQMTFSGKNLDLVSGLSAPFIAYFGYFKKKFNNIFLILWNLVCLALLLNVVVRAIYALPYSFQRLDFDQPNIAVLYFPFTCLPAFIVPAVLFAHLVCLRHLTKGGKKITPSNLKV